MPQSYFSMARVKTTWPSGANATTGAIRVFADLCEVERRSGDRWLVEKKTRKAMWSSNVYAYIYIYRISQMDEWTYRWIGNNIGKPPNAFDQFTFEWYFFGGLPHCCFSGVPKKPLVGDFSPLPPVVTSSLLWKTTKIIIDESSK